MGVSILVFVSLLSDSTPTLYGTAKGKKYFDLSKLTYAYTSCRTKTAKEASVTLAGDYISGKFKLNV